MDDRTFYRIGAVCAVVGGVLGVIFNLLHPRGSEFVNDFPKELQTIADSGLWITVHVGIGLALLIGIGAAAPIARYLSRGRGAPWAWTGLVLFVLTASLGVVTVAIDGWASKQMANAWVHAAPAAKPAALLAARAVSAVGTGLFSALIVSFFGITPLVFGMAFLADGTLPGAFAWASFIGGALGLLSGLLQSFNGISTFATNIVFPVASVLFTVVLILVGVRLWRIAERAPAAPLGAA